MTSGQDTTVKSLTQQLIQRKRSLEFLQYKGTSTSLSSYPSKKARIVSMPKRFNDVIHNRYDWKLHDTSAVCESGEANSADHAMICKLEGFTILRHTIVRDISAEMLQRTCKDISIEVVLNSSHTDRKVNTMEQKTAEKEEARLNISCQGLWRRLQRTFYDFRTTHLNNNTILNKTTQQLLKIHENSI